MKPLTIAFWLCLACAVITAWANVLPAAWCLLGSAGALLCAIAWTEDQPWT